MPTSVAERRVRLTIRGAVQGVGFRPFIYRLAKELGLCGWVCNAPSGVLVEVEGEQDALRVFRERVASEKPPRSSIHGIEHVVLDPVSYRDFTIRDSERHGQFTALVMPDVAACADCLREVFDPADRRYRYPFANCTHCGPRYSIIEALPYDRANTTMRCFALCERCRREYDDPGDRRFHAQPNACPRCGPRLELLDSAGRPMYLADEALQAAARAVRDGRILALKGIGGFQLLADAQDDEAVRRLRDRKDREEKPFALMAVDVDQARELCELSSREEAILGSPEAPIVLLKRRGGGTAESVAPGNPYLGLMLPYTPLHHLLMKELGFPIVATSGNLRDEPICKDNLEALERLGRVADVFLVHNRPIARRVDDSVVRVVADREMVLRRARGYAPLPITLSRPVPRVLAVGAYQKSTTAVALETDVFLSQHLGDMGTSRTLDAFRESIDGLERLFDFRASQVVCDLHPDYPSTRFAEALSSAPRRVQHHYAHVLSCMAENELAPPVLGVAWDGTGYGLDGTIWGGEFLAVRRGGFDRIAHLRTFRLPGGEQAVREPRRCALGVLYELFGDNVPLELGFSLAELDVLLTMLRTGLNSPVTSSAGRLFDALSAIIGLRTRSSFEGQAAMELEFAVEPCDECYDEASVDWSSIVRGALDDRRRGVAPSRIAARLHNSLVEAICREARNADRERVVLTGGCFQNKVLTERAIRRLREDGFRPYWHQRVPPNDGGIALGQIAACAEE